MRVLHVLGFDNSTRAKNKINSTALLVLCHNRISKSEHDAKH